MIHKYYIIANFIKSPLQSTQLLFQHHLENSFTIHYKILSHHQFLN